jgi:hypothetical protein
MMKKKGAVREVCECRRDPIPRFQGASTHSHAHSRLEESLGSTSWKSGCTLAAMQLFQPLA